MKILFKTADIFQRDRGRYTAMKSAYLATDGSIISHIGSARPQGVFDCEIDMRGKLLIPGKKSFPGNSSSTQRPC